MGSINRVVLVGHIGADPDLRVTQSGQSVMNLRMATNSGYKAADGTWQSSTEWHSVVMWGSRADVLAKLLRVGATIAVEGRLKTRKWQDKTGNDRYTTEVVASDLQLLDKKGDASSATTAGSSVPDDFGSDDIPF